MPTVRYNERSWGIDLISFINTFLNDKDLIIKRAGGEYGVSGAENIMFPDVLLFADNQSARVLQGWELKMPDTDIDDTEFIENAHKKAKRLKLNSFLLWNVNVAKLYTINENASLRIIKEWSLNQNLTREEVECNKELWLGLLKKDILPQINEYIRTGAIHSAKISETLTSDDIVDFISSNKYLLIEEYSNKIASSSRFQDEVTFWWNSVKKEYKDKTNAFEILADINILSWINKFIFANLIKRHFSQATSIEKITNETSITDAIIIIENISKNCDFWNIFKKQLGNELLPDLLWNDLKNLNLYLIDAQIQNLEITDWQNIFENLISVKHRKLYGQYSTPPMLANLLVNLTVDNKNLSVLDPCCGTGTIVKEVLNIKKQYCVNKEAIYEKIWASDKIAFPLQLATVSLFDPEESKEIINIFQEDVANLEVSKDILFFDPENGNEIVKKLPDFDYIVSNLPFVKGQDIPEYNEMICSINNDIENLLGQEFKLDLRADLSYYIPFKLWSILKNNSKLGIIIPNAWLGTATGKKFRGALLKFYDIENIITSGKGRWFDNAKIVANILILKRKITPTLDDNENKKIFFTTLKQKISDVNIEENLSFIRHNDERDNDIVRKVAYTHQEIMNLENIGLQWSSLFTDLKWFVNINEKLTTINKFFNVKRGMKSGLDPFFYSDVSNIDGSVYFPLLHDSECIKTLQHNQPDQSVFCCNKSLDYLKKNYNEIYNKIINTSPSSDGLTPPNVSLRPVGENWYKIAPIRADIVTSLNPDKRLFFARVSDDLLINQRLILMDYKSEYTDTKEQKVLHALLNSILGIFYIEALSFGRGDGVADLSSDKFKKCFKLLDIELLSDSQIDNIISSFEPLLTRNIKDSLKEELECSDRKLFDRTVLEVFDLLEYEHLIKEALLNLYNIRQSVKI